jgi:hypothetical protein
LVDALFLQGSAQCGNRWRHILGMMVGVVTRMHADLKAPGVQIPQQAAHMRRV